MKVINICFSVFSAYVIICLWRKINAYITSNFIFHFPKSPHILFSFEVFLLSIVLFWLAFIIFNLINYVIASILNLSLTLFSNAKFPVFDYRNKLVSAFNPHRQILTIIQIVGNYYLLIFKNRIDDISNEKDNLQFILPFNNIWSIVRGGITPEDSHSWLLINQRFAFDFIIREKNGFSYKENKYDLNSYYCFNQLIFAPEDGEIIKVKDSCADYKNVGKYFTNWLASDIRGNYVIIKHSKNKYSLIAHIKKRSITVKKGELIKKGQPLARCGNSGNSTEPHIHYQLQSGKSFYFSKGLPVKFHCKVYDKTAKDFKELDDYISKGQIICNS